MNEKKFIIEVDDLELGCILQALKVLFCVHVGLGDPKAITDYINSLSEKVGAIKND